MLFEPRRLFPALEQHHAGDDCVGRGTPEADERVLWWYATARQQRGRRINDIGEDARLQSQ